jgi:hypothetical protein
MEDVQAIQMMRSGSVNRLILGLVAQRQSGRLITDWS